jgi:hypothetical protein
LITAFALLLLVPSAQALTETPHFKVNIVGAGSGIVKSKELSSVGLGRGTPPIECSYDGTSTEGACENTPSPLGEEEAFYAEEVVAVPAAGSRVVGWTVDKGSPAECPIPGLGGEVCLFDGGEGEGIEWEVTLEFALEPTGPVSYKLNVHTSGAGAGSFQCEVAGVEGSCANEYQEGTKVKVIPHANTGSSFVEFNTENGGECSDATCEFIMNAEHTANAEFSLIAESSTVAKNGNGTVQCEDVAVGGGPGVCAASYPYGHQVRVTATPETGWRLESLTGTGSAKACSVSSCLFTIEEPSGITVDFGAISHPSTLTVFKDGHGEGTVIIAPGQPGEVKCLPASEACEATLEEGETVELEQTAGHGSTFAGWLGCREILASNRCRVTLSGPEPEVAAVFLTEGVPGETPLLSEFDGTHEPAGKPCQGRGGLQVSTVSVTKFVCDGTIGGNGETPTLSEFDGSHEPAGKPCQGRGGVQVSTASVTKYVCDGTIGKDGERGEIGFPGEHGTTGAQGSQGPAGPAGTNGIQGPQGSQGPAGSQGSQGPQGKQGPAGKVSVICRVSNAKKVACTVKNAKASASASGLRWTLRRGRRGGRVVGHGDASAKHLERVLDHLRDGRYLLNVNGQVTAIVIPTRHTDGGRYHA